MGPRCFQNVWFASRGAAQCFWRDDLCVVRRIFQMAAPFRTTRRSSLQKSHSGCEQVRADIENSEESFVF